MVAILPETDRAGLPRLEVVMSEKRRRHRGDVDKQAREQRMKHQARWVDLEV